MLWPDEVRQTLARRWARRHRGLLNDAGAAAATGAGGRTGTAGAADERDWPWVISLAPPTEQAVAADPAAVRAWVLAWEQASENAPSRPAGIQLDWAERQWPRLGRQRLPERLRVEHAAALAASVGEGPRWSRARQRQDRLLSLWPALAASGWCGRWFDLLADYADADVERLVGLLHWSQAHPASGLYLRQLPVPGLDTKWIGARGGAITELLRAVSKGAANDQADATDLHGLLGLRRAPARIRVRLLCPLLRGQAGGLGDIEAPVEDLARLPVRPRVVLIVENLESGLALPDLPAVAAVLKLGAAVRLAAQVGWIAQAERCLYWGDIDSHGFEILQRARSALPRVQSVLMSASLLLQHLDLCVEEPVPAHAETLPLLTAAEHEVYEGLRSDRWGRSLRLEQERLPWARVLDELQGDLAAGH